MTGNGMAVCGWIADEDRGGGRGRSLTAPVVRDAAVRVERQLGRVRTLLRRLDPVTLGISGHRYEALLLSYDVYVCMLVDALADTVDALANVGGPDGDGGGDPAEDWVGAAVPLARAAAGRATPVGIEALDELADAARHELRWLQSLMAPAGPEFTGLDRALTDDWRIADQGLFGADGVLPVILGISARPEVADVPRRSTSDGWWTVTSDAA